jgi:FkbM family methyltransferase
MNVQNPLVHQIKPATSRKPFIGPVITALRRMAWRVCGLQQAFAEQERTDNAIVRQLGEVFEAQGSFQFRSGTLDAAIFSEVILQNEYRLPRSFHSDDIILDIGMHIGSFCYAALKRGSHHVHGFEAENGNYTLATKNLGRFGERVRTYHKAVWRSDRQGDKLFHEGASAPNAGGNTGGGCILFPNAGEALDVVAFDDIIRDVTHDGRQRVKLLKIDCEGSEYPILLTARTLHLIDNIHGEFHEMGPGTCNAASPIPAVAQVEGVESFTIEVLVGCLERAGFTVTWARHGESFHGMFFASRTGGLS